MNELATALWDRALRAIETAAQLANEDPDASASRAYYAAFYAVSAYFASQGRMFNKHTALESAVHRDLVKAGRMPQEVGAAFTQLSRVRMAGDYGAEDHVSVHGSHEAVMAARSVLDAVRGILREPVPDKPAPRQDMGDG